MLNEGPFLPFRGHTYYGNCQNNALKPRNGVLNGTYFCAVNQRDKQ